MNRPRLRVFLVRHGAVQANLELRHIGRRDDPLGRTGLAQAQRLGQSFAELEIGSVLTSPLSRAVITARAIADTVGAPLTADRRLIEMDFGDWEGLTRDEICERSDRDRDQFLSWQENLDLAPPGGESLVDVQRRCGQLLDHLVADPPTGPVVIVSHVGPIKAMLCTALDLPLTATRRLFLDPGTITVVDWADRATLRLFNSHGHLGWMNARWMRDVSDLEAAARR
jgi:probable phosphoglycerate mutase